MLGLLLIVVDLLARVKVDGARWPAAARRSLLAAVGARTRARRSGRPGVAVGGHGRKSPNKPRAHFQLGFSVLRGRPATTRAIAEFEKAARLQTPDYNLLVDLGPRLRRDEPARIKRWRNCGRRRRWSRPRTSIRRSAWSTRKQRSWQEALDGAATGREARPELGADLQLSGEDPLSVERTAAGGRRITAARSRWTRA